MEPPEAPSDAELIARVRSGDLEAYGELFGRHHAAAERMARQLVPPNDAADLAADAFAKVLDALRNGGGPDISFRAYLLTTVRRVHVDRIQAGRRVQSTDDIAAYEREPETFDDPAVTGFESGAAAKAFTSLPERWQAVLWHTEVEGEKPAAVAPLLGLTPNGVSALAYRAREGLRQAYLQQHLADLGGDGCRWTTERLGAYVRGGLTKRENRAVREHLDGCARCTALYLELVEVNSALPALLAPALLGTAGMGYLAAVSGTGIGVSGLLARGRHRATQNSAQSTVATGAAVGGAVVVVVVAAVLVVKMFAGDDTDEPVAEPVTIRPSLPIRSPVTLPTVEPTIVSPPPADPSTALPTSPPTVPPRVLPTGPPIGPIQVTTTLTTAPSTAPTLQPTRRPTTPVGSVSTTPTAGPTAPTTGPTDGPPPPTTPPTTPPAPDAAIHDENLLTISARGSAVARPGARASTARSSEDRLLMIEVPASNPNPVALRISYGASLGWPVGTNPDGWTCVRDASGRSGTCTAKNPPAPRALRISFRTPTGGSATDRRFTVSARTGRFYDDDSETLAAIRSDESLLRITGPTRHDPNWLAYNRFLAVGKEPGRVTLELSWGRNLRWVRAVGRGWSCTRSPTTRSGTCWTDHYTESLNTEWVTRLLRRPGPGPDNRLTVRATVGGRYDLDSVQLPPR